MKKKLLVSAGVIVGLAGICTSVVVFVRRKKLPKIIHVRNER